MSDKQLMMNCILVGAEVADLLLSWDEDTAREKLSNLTSEFEPQDVEYLLQRLKAEI